MDGWASLWKEDLKVEEDLSFKKKRNTNKGQSLNISLLVSTSLTNFDHG